MKIEENSKVYNPKIISGISDPNCQEETKILESLLEVAVGATEPLTTIYKFAKFSLTYLDKPEKMGDFLKDLKALKDKYLEETRVKGEGIMDSAEHLKWSIQALDFQV
jgi:hypothetical protein